MFPPFQSPTLPNLGNLGALRNLSTFGANPPQRLPFMGGPAPIASPMHPVGIQQPVQQPPMGGGFYGGQPPMSGPYPVQAPGINPTWGANPPMGGFGANPPLSNLGALRGLWGR